MYINSEPLLKEINTVAERIGEATDNAVRYEEYIALPYFGHIILRFDLKKEDPTVDDLDAYETVMRRAAGDRFLVDFMGSVYRKCGMEYSGLEERYRMLARKYAGVEIVPSAHREHLLRDAAEMLKRTGMDPASDVWEIQAEDDGFVLLIMDEKTGKIREPDAECPIYVGTVSRESCTGLMKAAIAAGNANVSLLRVMADP